MRILAIETSTNICSVALVQDGIATSEINVIVRTGHAGRLLPMIETLLGLDNTAKEDLDLIAVGCGPGSFTGIRIGMATARGLSLALGCPLKGISTLDALALGALPSPLAIVPVIDARKSEVFCARYAPDGSRQSPYLNIRPEEIGDLVPEETLFIGNGLDLYGDILASSLGERFRKGPKNLWYPRASFIGLLASDDAAGERFPETGPIYVRPSDATLSLVRPPKK